MFLRVREWLLFLLIELKGNENYISVEIVRWTDDEKREIKIKLKALRENTNCECSYECISNWHLKFDFYIIELLWIQIGLTFLIKKWRRSDL